MTSPQVVQSTAPIGAAAICVGHACDRTRSSSCGALGRAAQPAPLPVLATLRRPARLPGAAADAEPQKGLSRASSGSKPRWRRRARGVPASSAAVQPSVARTPPQLRRRPLEASPTPGPQLPASAGPPTSRRPNWSRSRRYPAADKAGDRHGQPAASASGARWFRPRRARDSACGSIAARRVAFSWNQGPGAAASATSGHRPRR